MAGSRVVISASLGCVAYTWFLGCRPCPSLKRRARSAIRCGELGRRSALALDLFAVETALVRSRRHHYRLAASERHANALAPMRPEHHRAPMVGLGVNSGLLLLVKLEVC